MKNSTLLYFVSIVFGILIIISCKSGRHNKTFQAESERKVNTELVSSMLKDSMYYVELKCTPYSCLASELDSLYILTDYNLAWIDVKNINQAFNKADTLIAAINNAPTHGLDPEFYRISEIIALEDEIANEYDDTTYPIERKLVELDYLLTSAYFNYGYHLFYGRAELDQIIESWIGKYQPISFANHLLEALKSDNIMESIADLTPRNTEYENLRKGLALYRKIQENGGWEPIMLPKEKLELGDSLPEVLALKNRLRLTHDYASIFEEDNELYDEYLKKAVADFQERNGLTPDGVVGKSTIDMINIPVDKKIDKIKLNMERLRWRQANFEGDFIVVNIPAYQMKLFKDGRESLDMKVIVGESYDHETPIFSDSMEYIAFSPTWNVPLSIARNEMLPKLKADCNYLDKMNCDAYAGWTGNEKPINCCAQNIKNYTSSNFNWRIVQRPGPGNALGKVKFIFPNSKNIYLHDTPTDHLFNRTERDFSHGCIRVEKPADLAYTLLKDQGYTEVDVYENMNLTEPKNVALKEKLPVYITYRTAWVDEKGKVNFRPDIYNYDAAQLKSMDIL